MYLTQQIHIVKTHSMPLFSGSLSESAAPMAQYAKEDNLPYLLLDEGEREFLLALPIPDQIDCTKAVLIARKGKSEGDETQGNQNIGHVCDGVTRWGAFSQSAQSSAARN
ncbi:MAG: hypothetical protein HYZ71_02375 [Deltaproteobacteria bacterium]|nr:hypothetical protein [Deltaproteobacteria bacterium]